MKTLRFALVLFALVTGLVQAQASGRASIRVILITTATDSGVTDGQLQEFQAALQQSLRAQAFHFVGDKSVVLGIPATTELALGAGHVAVVSTDANDGKIVKIKLRWMADGRPVMNTPLALRAGLPAVINGPFTNKKRGETYALIVIGS
jgi:hypothetical protein